MSLCVCNIHDIHGHKHVSKLNPADSVRSVGSAMGLSRNGVVVPPFLASFLRESSEKPLGLGLHYFLPTPHFLLLNLLSTSNSPFFAGSVPP